ncbi:hypothetical protein [Chromobacterium haemolyticum]|uniref:hypothetical protein n=1 Tax=Chromobacterium haemolyticum TaxID=394935 RepID=UPI0012DCE3F1|nr:hypothetical protein [Chromobacterium haemolyticum]
MILSGGKKNKFHQYEEDISLVIVTRCYVLLFEKIDDDDGIIYFGVKSDTWKEYPGMPCLFGGRQNIRENDKQTIIRELKEESKGTFVMTASANLFRSFSNYKFYWAFHSHGPIGDLHAGPGDELKDIIGVSALHLKKYAKNRNTLAEHLISLTGGKTTSGGAKNFLNSHTLEAIQYWLTNIFPTICPGIKVWP